MAVNRSVKARYVSSTLTLGAILLFTACAGVFIDNDRLMMVSIGRNEVKACTELIVPVGAEFELEGPPERTCIEMGNKSQPQGTMAKFFSLIADLAPFVALAFGIPAI